MLQRPGGGGGDSLLVIAARVVQAPNDKQQIEPMLERIGTLPEDLGKPETLLADTGYFSEANVALCAAAQIDPMIAQGRQLYYPPLSERFAKVPSAPENPTPLEAMSHRLQTPEGKKLYALRKQIPEPVFGIIQISPPKQDRLSAGPVPDIRWSVCGSTNLHHPQVIGRAGLAERNACDNYDRVCRPGKCLSERCLSRTIDHLLVGVNILG